VAVGVIPGGARAPRIALLLVVLVGAAIRLPGLDREVSHDEAYSWIAYASRPSAEIVSSYNLPNNHILHSLLMRASTRQLGEGEEWVLRVPAYVAGVAALPVAARVAVLAGGGAWAGPAAAAWLAVHPAHVGYSRSARGYTLLMFFALLAWWGLLRADVGVAGWTVFSVGSFLAAWTLPSGAILLASLALVALVRGWRSAGWPGVRAPLLASGAAGLGVLLAYAGLRQDLDRAAALFGVDVRGGDLAGFASAAAHLWLGGWAGSFLVALAAAALWFARGRDNHLRLTALALTLVPVAAALVSGVAGQARSYVYVVPFVVVLAGIGMLRFNDRRVGLALGCLGMLWFGGRSLPSADGPAGHAEIAAAARQGAADVLIAPVYLDVPLDFYTRDAEVDQLTRALAEGRQGALLFAVHEVDRRSSFDQYHLFDDDNVLTTFEIPQSPFIERRRSGRLRLLSLERALPVYPSQEIEWDIARGSAGLRLADPALGPAPSLGLLADGEFVVVDATRFASQSAGFMSILYGLRGASTVATLCHEEADGWQPETAYRGQVLDLPAVTDTHGREWALQARLVSVEPGRFYAVCATGSDPGERYLGDLLYTFYPFREGVTP
jgi:hypothetical protein